MAESTDVLVIGGGPGGLACAARLAEGGARVVLVERKPAIGAKVCAGGLTGASLMAQVPDHLVERRFHSQVVRTRWQRQQVRDEQPIIVTVNRERFGGWMAGKAEQAGVTLLTGTQVLAVGEGRAVLTGVGGSQRSIGFGHLVGADGSSSLVRRFLGLPTSAMGVGLNCMLPGRVDEMEWHLDAPRFGAGYAWIFPHAEAYSLGAFCDQRALSALQLKQRLLAWARQFGHDVPPQALRAGLVNYDYRGFHFGRTWLVGDAAGLASGLTGEGIASALVSGRAVAELILDPAAAVPALERLIGRQRQHHRFVRLVGRSPMLSGVLMEGMMLALRLKMIDYRLMDMAD